MRNIEIYDPPMCCSTGLCGPDVDEELLSFQEAVLKIEKEFKGEVEIKRHGLNSNPQAFMSSKVVKETLDKEGVDVLPITTIDGKLAKKGGYLSYGELLAAIKG